MAKTQTKGSGPDWLKSIVQGGHNAFEDLIGARQAQTQGSGPQFLKDITQAGHDFLGGFGVGQASPTLEQTIAKHSNPQAAAGQDWMTMLQQAGLHPQYIQQLQQLSQAQDVISKLPKAMQPLAQAAFAQQAQASMPAPYTYSIDPLATQAFYSNIISPFLQQIGQGQTQNADDYSKTMGEVSKQFPATPAIQQALAAMTATNSANMKNMAGQNQAAALAGPQIDQLNQSLQQQQKTYLQYITDLITKQTSSPNGFGAAIAQALGGQ